MIAVPAMKRAAGWMWDLFAHDHAEKLRTIRAVHRKAHGVDMEDYPYPGAVTGSNNPTIVNNASGIVKGALLGALALATGAGAALALPSLLRTPQAQQTAPGGADATPTITRPSNPGPSTSPSAPPAAVQGWDAIYEEQQPDGTWKQTRREHLK